MKCFECAHWEFEETDKAGRRWGACSNGKALDEILIMDHSPSWYSEYFGCIFAQTPESWMDQGGQG